jgi:hypothetical protein
MRYVILRDDDTNALTPIECLERLYRPFLDRGLPVNLATIPEVRVDARTPDDRREGFLPAEPKPATETVALAENGALVGYLRRNSGYHIAQHGCHHDMFEFDLPDRAEIVRRIDWGARRLREAGFSEVKAFVAPHDKFSAAAYEEVARHFPVISSGWFEWRRLPWAWRAKYLGKKILGRPHWRVGATQLLSHPGCLLSNARPYGTMLDAIRRAIASQPLTVLVTHWWEYFHGGRPDEAFIRVLHDTARYLASEPDVRVISFAQLAASGLRNGGGTETRCRPDSDGDHAGRSTPRPCVCVK